MNRLSRLADTLMPQDLFPQAQGEPQDLLQPSQADWGNAIMYNYSPNDKTTSNLTRIIADTEIERGMFAPLVEYADGRIELGLPQVLNTPVQAVRNMLAPGYDYSNTQQAARDSFDAAGLVGAGGYALPKPSGAIGAFGARIPRGGFEIDYFGTPVQIVQNPSQSALAGLINKTKYKAVRRITDPETGDTYVWDAADPALHQMVAETLGLDYSKMVGDMIGIDD